MGSRTMILIMSDVMKRISMITLIAALLPACQPDPRGEQTDPTLPASSEPSQTLTATHTDAPNITPTRTPAPTLSVIGLDPPIDLPAPLLFTTRDGPSAVTLWLFDEAKHLRKLASLGGTTLHSSPDRKQVLYGTDADIWMMDVSTGETRNLTQDGEDQLELHPAWWPNHDGIVMASGWLDGCTDGYLAYIGFDGTYQLLDSELKLFAPPAVSPDGSTIAYAGRLAESCVDAGELRLYREGQAPTRLNLADFGLDKHSIRGISWSPDATRLGLATIVFLPEEARYQEYIVILNLAQRTSRILYEFKKFHASSDQASTPVWSPTGDWLVFHTGELLSLGGETKTVLWYADADEVRPLIPAEDASQHAFNGHPDISPDGEWVVVAGKSAITFVRISDGELFSWDVNGSLNQVVWVSAP